MVGRGANGGLAGADMRILQNTDRKINIVGIDNHELTGLDVVAAAALFDTQKRLVVGIFHEYAHLGKGRSIHAAVQIDRIFTIKLGLSQSLMVQEGSHNPNVTLKGCPKKLWGLFGQKAHRTQQITLKTQQITLFPPKEGLSLTLTYQGLTYNTKL